MKPSTTATHYRAAALALIAGLVFAAGLTLGGMTDPRKVQGFLNIGGILSGKWDPSLAFVMGGALAISLIAFWSIKRRLTPWFAGKFEIPARRDIDARLVIGAALFGIGWGIGGYCPGPALASFLIGGADIFYFMAAMIAGMVGAKLIFK